MLDRYISGNVSRISPEAPIPVLLKQKETAVLGGAGNVAANITTLGATALPVGLLGDCAEAREICHRLEQLNIDARHLKSTGPRTTPVKTRFIGGHQQILRLDNETIQPPSAEELTWLLDAARTVECDIAILSDYGKGTLLGGACEALIEVLSARNIPVLVDPKGTDYSKYRGATALSPNLKELSEVSGTALKNDDNIIAAARRLITDLDLEFMIATRGEDGLSMVFGDRDFHIPTFAREVFDVSGAGDTLISAFSVAYAAGHSVEDSSRIANAAAGLVVAKNGTATVTGDEVEQALHKRSQRNVNDKIVTCETARSRIEGWRSRGLTVGFTNGCFDILHPGHISLFTQSAARCDRLVIGLNTDASVSRLKGPSRPVVDQSARAEVLAALGMIDLIVQFDEDTPLELITALLPDVLVKGADYQEHEIVGADVVKANGGRVERAVLVDGKSTSNIVRRIAQNTDTQ